VEVTILGSGASLPSPDRVLAGVMVETGGEALIFDIGAGVLHRLTVSLPDMNRIEHVFITHFHVDHCSDLAALLQTLWLMGYGKTLHVYGPKHVEKAYKGLEMIFPYLMDKVHLKLQVVNAKFRKESRNWTVTAFPVKHGDIESYGYAIDAEGRRVVYSGDTAPCRELVQAAKGADLLIHECSLPDQFKDKAPHHTTPTELGVLAAEAGVRTLVLTHLYPELIDELANALSCIRRTFSGKVVVPRDTQIITL